MNETDRPLLRRRFQAALGEQGSGQLVGRGEGLEARLAGHCGKVARRQVRFAAQAAGGGLLWILEIQTLEVRGEQRLRLLRAQVAEVHLVGRSGAATPGPDRRSDWSRQ